MRILVTGGAGFIGSHVSESLLRAGHAVAVLDDLNDYYPVVQKLHNLNEIRKAGALEFEQGDICDVAKVGRFMDRFQPDAILHLAARAGVRPSLKDPLLYQRVNCEGTTVLLETARQRGIRRFVFASSSSVYGAANRVPFCEDDAVQRPISPYAATKIAGEALCHAHGHLYGMQISCLRFFTVYGPRQRPDLAIRRFIERIQAGQPIQMFGDGSAGRDYTYIDDIVSGIVSALALEHPFEVFNLGNARPVLLREMIATIEKVIGRAAIIEQMPVQPGDVPVTFASIAKAEATLGYRPAVGLEDGVRRTVEWLASL
ncbi:MAG: GDP-mannose 4,6-dehydratase [Bryobacterales bacterium]|nr:GDP-mannose 4,6-dehydratase [Bryobacterales bacterium]